jgi:hypothetical protein
MLNFPSVDFRKSVKNRPQVNIVEFGMTRYGQVLKWYSDRAIERKKCAATSSWPGPSESSINLVLSLAGIIEGSLSGLWIQHIRITGIRVMALSTYEPMGRFMHKLTALICFLRAAVIRCTDAMGMPGECTKHVRSL